MGSQHLNKQCLFCTDKGIVQTNGNSSVYTVEFGNMLLHLNARNFSSFTHFVLKSNKKTITKMVCTHSDKVILQPDKAWCNYAFTIDEFFHLQELLAGAASIINIKSDINSILNKTL